MGWRLLKVPSTLQVTRKLAIQFRDMEPVPNDRTLSLRRLEVYNKIWQQGQFRTVTWASARCLETGTTYRVNGQHTSTMLAEFDVLPQFFVTIEEYVCDTLEDVGRLWATFDSKMNSRSADEIYNSFAGTMESLSAIPRALLRVTITGIAYHRFGPSVYSHTQATDRAELILDNEPFALWAHKLLTEGGIRLAMRRCTVNRQMYKMGVLAAMFGTYFKNNIDATNFWIEVRDDSNPVPTSPSRRLSRFLLSTTVDSGNGSRTKKDKASSREFYVCSLHAWNAWRRKENTDLRYYPSAGVPDIK